MRGFEIVDHSILTQFTKNPMLNPYFSIVEDDLDLLNFDPTPPISFFDESDIITDLIQIDQTPFRTSTRRVTRRVGYESEIHIQKLLDRVSALELGLSNRKEKERKYTWTAEIKDDVKKRYKWTAEIKGGEYSPVERKYTVEVSNGDGGKKKKCEKGKVKGKSVGPIARVVEIEEEPSVDDGAYVLRQVFAKRVEKRKGKKELAPQDAAALIQMSFRDHIIRRSQTLRALRELAIAKNKLKDMRALFNNFSYRRLLARDAEERQRFSEKIIVLLLTVDAIEGADPMVRSAKKSMVDELEAMLDVVEPQPTGKYLSIQRRTFDMPDRVINKTLAAGVAQVVQLLEQEATSSETFEEYL
ncbi:hypothetical protein RD792_005242 [Penstemon davidsonii]|uniref:BAG domain-containing protein n=1 Tax=Penstemon davidsonii TaxID=160366 RepID=A0ABR0DKU4_9LAMI|nr:hypothetical protein RD792_005242 [Penstemon davidsonii]